MRRGQIRCLPAWKFVVTENLSDPLLIVEAIQLKSPMNLCDHTQMFLESNKFKCHMQKSEKTLEEDQGVIFKRK